MRFEPSRRACEAMLWFILFFSVAAFGATEWWSRAVLESLIFALAAMCLASREVVHSGNALLPGLLGIVLIGSFQRLDPHPLAGPIPLAPFTAAPPQTTYALLEWAALSAYSWCAGSLLQSKDELKRLALVVFAIGMFIAAAGIMQRGAGNIAYYGLRPIESGNPFGPFTNYDHAANWMSGALFCGMGALGALVFERHRRPTSEVVAIAVLIVFGISVLGAAIWMSGSRGALNAVCLSALGVALILCGSIESVRRRWANRAVVLVFAVSYATFVAIDPQWIGLDHGRFDVSAAYRLSMYRSSLKLILDHPVFGVGLGATQVAFRPYQENALQGLVDHVHSSWLEILVETGLIGGAVFISATAGSLVSAIRRLGREHFRKQPAIAAVVAAIIALLIHGLVEFNFQIPANALLLVTFLTAASGFNLASTGIPRIPFLRTLLVVALVCLAIVSLIPGVDGFAPRLRAPFIDDSDRVLTFRDVLAPPVAARRAAFKSE